MSLSSKLNILNLPFLKLELVLKIVTGLSLWIWEEDQELTGTMKRAAQLGT